MRRALRGFAFGGTISLAIVLAAAFIATRLVSSGTVASPHNHAHHLSRRPDSARGAAPSTSPYAAASGPALPVHLLFHHPPRAGLLFDLHTGRVLWAIDPARTLPIASLAKMMTALLVVRALHSDAPVRITHNAVNAAGSKVGVLPAGREARMETLLYGLLLPSGNDAAVALAEAIAGSVPRFVARMNDEARRLGLSCTHYASPDGLQDANRSCAEDLATLARLDLDDPRIARVAATFSTVQPLPIKGGKVWLYNNNPLLRYAYPGAIGLKTGETEAAGLCLVGAAQRDGVRLGVVLLHSPELGRQAEALLDAGFRQVYGQAPLPSPPVPKGR